MKMKVSINPSSLHGTVTAPPSKSAGHRSIICAALANSPVTIFNCGESDDMTATINSIKGLGATVERSGSTLYITPAKRNTENAVIDCNESGSTARFMIPVAAALGVKNVTFTGKGRLPQRPFGILSDALRQNGVEVSSDTLPMTVSGRLKCGTFHIPGNVSSQYISGLLLGLSMVEGESQIILTSPLESEPYVDITIKELKAFGADIRRTEQGYFIKGQNALTAAQRTVEGDWSQAAFFLCGGAVSNGVTVKGLRMDSLQGDKEIVDLLCRFGADITVDGDSVEVIPKKLKGIEIDASQIPDLVPILAVTAAFAEGTTVIKNAERLRIKESDRIKETVSRLVKFGINAHETDDGMIIEGGVSHGCDITSANDHRIVMAFSVLAANSCGTSNIDGAEAINKSYPLFFEDFIKIGGDATCHPQLEI